MVLALVGLVDHMDIVTGFARCESQRGVFFSAGTGAAAVAILHLQNTIRNLYLVVHPS